MLNNQLFLAYQFQIGSAPVSGGSTKEKEKHRGRKRSLRITMDHSQKRFLIEDSLHTFLNHRITRYMLISFLGSSSGGCILSYQLVA